MLSGKLVQIVETHWQEIAARLIRKIRSHPETPRLAALTDAEIREWCRAILANLGGWLDKGTEEEVRRRYEVMGAARFEESIPLPEAVLRLHMLKGALIDFVHEEWMPEDTIQLYAEEELQRRADSFFDHLVYHVVCGYEQARRRYARYA